MMKNEAQAADSKHESLLELASISGILQACSSGLKENYLPAEYFANRIDELIESLNEVRGNLS